MLDGQLRSDVPIIDEMVKHGCIGGGKRFRPMLMLLVGQLLGDVNDRHILLATAIEMIHAATLIHDDILDGASERRHRPTVNSMWGNHGAVLFGDYLFTHAFYLASTAGDNFACQVIGRATNTVCEGELQQTDASGNYETSIDEYFQIIEKKTAALCACATLLGAHFAGADSKSAGQWETVGRDFGLAFQIVDDILDLRGEDEACGKTLGTDLETAKPTLPILLALADESNGQRELWIDRLSNHVVSRADVIEWLNQKTAFDEAFGKAQELVENAVQIASQNGDRTGVFQELGEFLLRRPF